MKCSAVMCYCLDVAALSNQGVLTCAPNAKNHRDLDITIAYDFKGALSSLDASQNYRLR